MAIRPYAYPHGGLIAEASPPHVCPGEADGDSLLPRYLELDSSPIAPWPEALDAAATDSFARLEIGVLFETFNQAARVGHDRGFPFGALPDQSKEHERLRFNH